MRHRGVHEHGELGRDPPSRPRRRPEQARRLPRVRHPLEDPPARSSTHPEPPGYRRTAPRRPSILEPLLPVVHQILEDDRKAPRKQRHTAVRIFRRLRDEHGYTGGLTVVKDAVRAWRRGHAEVFVPLAHPPGEAQVDFGEAEVTLDGRAAKVALFVMTLPYSDAIFVCAFPRECTEAFLEGHVRAFDFFGGVPRRISYDNSKIAVARITGSRDRRAHRRVPPAQEPSPVRVPLLPGAAAQREGARRDAVGYARRNFLVPVPALHGGLEGLNARLEADCRADLARRLRGKPATKAELLAEERAALLPLPAEAFEAARVEQPHADSLSLVRFDTNDYSVPTRVRPPPGHRRRDGRRGPHRRRRPRRGDPPPVAGAARGSSTTRSTTWPCWSASPAPWTSPPRWRAGSCRSASASCGGGWRPSSAGRGRGSSSRSCGCWSGRAWRS